MQFTVQKKDQHTRARTAIIETAHGRIETPAFIPVGTQASVKTLTSEELSTLGVQIFFVNTYHMYLRPGIRVIGKIGGLHRFMAWDKPLITDSGGFQVFSLARDAFRPDGRTRTDERLTVRIDSDGVDFQSHWDGSTHRLTPEISIGIQHTLGADIILALDDCTPYPVTHERATTSMERTHVWAQRSLQRHHELKMKNENLPARLDSAKRAGKAGLKRNVPALFGVIQGSVFKDLRRKSARKISSMDFDGIAIGGVSVGESKTDMNRVLSWVVPELPDNKPRHLLGVGEIDDIFTLVGQGIDTFDCVQPTRLARMGHVYIKSSKLKSSREAGSRSAGLNSVRRNPSYTLDITKSRFALAAEPIDRTCGCATCRTYSRAYIHHLFRVRELLAYRLTTIHNVHFVLELMGSIRRAIGNGTFLALKNQWLYNKTND